MKKIQQQFDIWSCSVPWTVVHSLSLSFFICSLLFTFLGTSQLWMGWQHSCSSCFHSFKTCWLVTEAVFSLSQLSAFVELWNHSIIMYFLHLYLKLSHLNLFPFLHPESHAVSEFTVSMKQLLMVDKTFLKYAKLKFNLWQIFCFCM